MVVTLKTITLHCNIAILVDNDQPQISLSDVLKVIYAKPPCSLSSMQVNGVGE